MKKKKTLLYTMMIICVSLHAEMPEEFKNFPKGSEPEYIASKIIQLYINAAESTTPITYPETCSWFGSLRFAGATSDNEMLQQLENRFIPLLGQNSGAMQKPNHVDNTVFGIVPLQLYMQTGNQTYYTLGINFADSQWTMPANPSAENKAKYQALLNNGLSWQTRYWIDDMYMITAIQSQAYLATKEEKYINRAAHEMTAYLDSLQCPNGLFYHSPSAPFFWGRGNGWMAVGMADLLTWLPENNADRPKILQEYRKMMETLKSYQNQEGLWNQLIDEPDAWTETSGSAMFTYAMITGVKNGWLDANQYAPIARKAWLALVTYLNDSFRLREVCVGTNIGYTKEYYLQRNRITGDRHGQAALLWCATALYQTERNSLAALKTLSYDYGILTPAFNPGITRYTCHLPAGIKTVTPHVTPQYRNTAVYSQTVDVVSTPNTTVTVTSADATTTRTYNIKFETGNDTDYTHLIINNDFDQAPGADCNPVSIAAGIDGWDTNGIPAWRLSKSTCPAKQFYGWTHDQSLLGTSTSQGINTDAQNKHGEWIAWIGGNKSGYTPFEFSQTINNLPAGTYKLQCLLAVGKDDRRNTQRLFANNKVQYFGNPSHYTHNLVEGEEYTFAGHTEFADANLEEMTLYTTITDNHPLKIGIRTSNKKGDGTITNTQQSPMFKVDYFRLTKIDPGHAANADLANITLSAGNIDFSPQQTQYNIQLPKETRVVTPVATASVQDARITGAGIVDLSSGTGTSTITVTALDGVTTKTYTINYTISNSSNIETHPTPPEINWYIHDGNLVVKGTDTYTIYNISGIQIAHIKDNAETPVPLKQGLYIVRTQKSQTFKVVIK